MCPITGGGQVLRHVEGTLVLALFLFGKRDLSRGISRHCTLASRIDSCRSDKKIITP